MKMEYHGLTIWLDNKPVGRIEPMTGELKWAYIPIEGQPAPPSFRKAIHCRTQREVKQSIRMAFRREQVLEQERNRENQS